MRAVVLVEIFIATTGQVSAVFFQLFWVFFAAILVAIVDRFPQGTGKTIDGRHWHITYFVNVALANVWRVIDGNLLWQAPHAPSHEKKGANQTDNGAMQKSLITFFVLKFILGRHRDSSPVESGQCCRVG